jgi:hypothetical protein
LFTNGSPRFVLNSAKLVYHVFPKQHFQFPICTNVEARVQLLKRAVIREGALDNCFKEHCKTVHLLTASLTQMRKLTMLQVMKQGHSPVTAMVYMLSDASAN